MRPCNKCRAPISNARLYCEKCEPTQEAFPSLEQQEEESDSVSIHAWLPDFLTNAVRTGVLVTIALMVIGTPVGLVLGGGRAGLVLAFVVGPLVGLGFALLELSQSK